MNARRVFVTSLLTVIYTWKVSSATAQTQSATTMSTISDYACVQRGPDFKVWQRSVVQTNEAGVVWTNQESYTELATGLCYQQNGQYVDSVEQVDPAAGGAQAVQGQHQVWWAANANTPNGVVILTTPDGKQLASTVFGLAYSDLASGSNAAIAQVQDCKGSIVAPNQVIYAGAFSNLTADVLYTYRKAGLSQDIVLRQAPPPPDQYGLSDQTTILQVYTEFFNPPQPETVSVTNGNVVDDRILDFGEMRIGIGQALFLKGQNTPLTAGLVSKQWVHVNGRRFLIESIPYPAISNQLQELPQASNLKLRRGSVRKTVLLDTSPSRLKAPTALGKPMKLSKAETRQPRLVVDYNLSGSTNNMTLQGDTTYYVSGGFTVSGTLTIEGGTVVKYFTNNGPCMSAANVICETGPYRPAVFTSMNDNTVGSQISGSTGNPGGNDTATYLELSSPGTNSFVFNHLRFSYGNFAIMAIITSISPTSSLQIWDSQFIECSEAFYAPVVVNNGPSATYPVSLYNVLLAKCGVGLNSQNVGQNVLHITANNVTADQMTTFQQGTPLANQCYGANCIFTAVTNLSGSFTSCVGYTSGAGIYQTVGAGAYYLAQGSTNQGAGTTNIDTNLLADLETKTTYPPVTNFVGWFTNDYTFFPQAQRDNSGATVDLGYHYDPLDYAIDMDVSNATVTVLPGTAIATAGSEYGAYLDQNSVFNSYGTATSPNWIVRYNTVQEQSNPNWETESWEGSITEDWDGTNSGTFGFTEWSALAGDMHFYKAGDTGYVMPFVFQDCQFYNGAFNVWQDSLTSSNCLWQRVNLNVSGGASGVTNVFCNNLFLAGTFEYSTTLHRSSGVWTMLDNLFDQTVISSGNNSSIAFCSNNAYVTTNFGVIVPENNDVILTNSPAFEVGSLGDYYYPTNQTNLIHAGSRPAPAAGLYHYTVTTNNIIEGTNQVSIGFHYVACSNSPVPVPIDTNGDGIPDYIEDANGNGQVDSGEIAWNVAGDLGLTVVITQPANNSIIP